MQCTSTKDPASSCEFSFQAGMDQFDHFLRSAPFSAASCETEDTRSLEVSCHTKKKHWGCDYKILLIDKSQGGSLNFGEIHLSSYVPSWSESAQQLNPVTIDYIQSYQSDAWKNVGTHLVHIAYNASKLMGNGNVNAYALSDAVGFYAKMGFTIDWESYEDEESEGYVDPAVIRKVQSVWERCISRKQSDEDALHLVLDAEGKERLLQKVMALYL